MRASDPAFVVTCALTISRVPVCAGAFADQCQTFHINEIFAIEPPVSILVFFACALGELAPNTEKAVHLRCSYKHQHRQRVPGMHGGASIRDALAAVACTASAATRVLRAADCVEVCVAPHRVVLQVERPS